MGRKKKARTSEVVDKQQLINRVDRALLDIGFCANAIRAKAAPERFNGRFSKVYAGPTGTLDVIRENIAHFKSSFSAESLRMADKDLCAVAALLQRREGQHWLDAAVILDGIESYLRLSLNSPMHNAEPEKAAVTPATLATTPSKGISKKTKRPSTESLVLEAFQKNPGITWTIRKLMAATGRSQGSVGGSKAWKSYHIMRQVEATSRIDDTYAKRHVDRDDLDCKLSPMDVSDEIEEEKKKRIHRGSTQLRGRRGTYFANSKKDDEWIENLMEEK